MQERSDCCCNIAITLIDPGRAILKECKRLFSYTDKSSLDRAVPKLDNFHYSASRNTLSWLVIGILQGSSLVWEGASISFRTEVSQ
jgi:hypothetical protein